MKNEKHIEIGILGEGNAWKSSICNALIGKEFSENTIVTIGYDKYIKNIILKDNEDINLVIWDINCEEREINNSFKILKKYIEGLILVFDVTKKKSFEYLNFILDTIKEYFNALPIILFGNKIDIDKDKWEIISEEATKFAKEKGFAYFETSAKTKEKINQGILFITNRIYDIKYDKNKEKNEIIINNKDINKLNKKSDCVRNKKNK